MKALSIMAHGSRNPRANEEFLNQAETITQKLDGNYSLAEHCFLELAEPSLKDACIALAEKGATEIDVYPMFFNRGRHVSVDVPKLVEGAQEALPNVTFRLLDYFGSGDDFAQAVASHIDRQG